jgi:hypothetical protein
MVEERCAISETGTGFAGAKLSEILPAARVARYVRMTNEARVARLDRDDNHELAVLALSG